MVVVELDEGKESMALRGGGWGTWEELVLGGAVLRHGASAWGAVAAELRSHARSSSSPSFSPEDCEAKFAEIQARYSPRDAWFEELRKQRVAELKRELEKSENSIGSLQFMIESLSNSRHENGNSDGHTSHTELCSHNENTADTNSSSKEISKDRSSAASFTEEASNNWAPQVQHCATDSIPVNTSGDSGQTILDSQVEKQSWLWGSRKKRGTRDRRIFAMRDENSRGDETTSTACIEREGSSEDCMKGLKTPNIGSGLSMSERAKINLSYILKTISTQGDCLMLQRQLDMQRRRARYKKMICRHMDFRILNSKIKSGEISSTKELLRDVLLFVNNILAFYPKTTLEHMAATALRDLACKTVEQCSVSLSKCSRAIATVNSPVVKKKARTLQPGRHGPQGAKRSKISSKDAGNAATKRSNISSKDAGNTIAKSEGKDSHGDAPFAVDVTTSRRCAPAKKRGVGRPPKTGQKRVRVQQDSTNKGRKKSRR